jgi:NADH-quinone oxidoreductase E subunit
MSDLEPILSRYRGASRDKVIPLLQEVQNAQGFLSREAMEEIAETLDLPVSKIYGVASFYNQFRFHAPGHFHIQVCRGTACHVKGSLAVLEKLERELTIKAGQTSRDGLFSLEVVACIGACGLAPVIAINGEFHGGVTQDQVPEILATYRARLTQQEN